MLVYSLCVVELSRCIPVALSVLVIIAIDEDIDRVGRATSAELYLLLKDGPTLRHGKKKRSDSRPSANILEMADLEPYLHSHGTLREQWRTHGLGQIHGLMIWFTRMQQIKLMNSAVGFSNTD